MEVKAHKLDKPEKTLDQKLFGKWKGRLFGALKSGLTYGQCAHLFRKETGFSPRAEWLGVFDSGSLDWKRRPKDEYTVQKLAVALKRRA